MIYRYFILSLVFSILSCASPAQKKESNDILNKAKQSLQFDTLVWSDEFATNGPLDVSKWFQQTQLPNGTSWYNNEIQHYTNRIDNAVIEGGILKIIAKKETFTNQGVTKQYTSARLNSKFAFTYGKVEIRAKLPAGLGTWPAMWMLGKNISEPGAYWQTQGFGTTPWPNCGEIDIMEHWGTNQNFVQSAIHSPSSFGNTSNKGGQTISNASSEFHVYALEWTPEKMIFSVDNIVHYTYNPPIKNDSTWPFDDDQYLLFNVAILPNIAANFTSSTLEIDYVRIYQQSTLANDLFSHDGDTISYPNPVSDTMTITVTSTNNEASATIFSVEGKLINTFAVPIKNRRILLDGLDQLTQGVYFIKLEIDGNYKTIKFVKK